MILRRNQQNFTLRASHHLRFRHLIFSASSFNITSLISWSICSFCISYLQPSIASYLRRPVAFALSLYCFLLRLRHFFLSKVTPSRASLAKISRQLLLLPAHFPIGHHSITDCAAINAHVARAHFPLHLASPSLTSL